MKNKLRQLLIEEHRLLGQVNCITQWAGPMFCTSQMEELKQVREKIATLQDKM